VSPNRVYLFNMLLTKFSREIENLRRWVSFEVVWR